MEVNISIIAKTSDDTALWPVGKMQTTYACNFLNSAILNDHALQSTQNARLV